MSRIGKSWIVSRTGKRLGRVMSRTGKGRVMSRTGKGWVMSRTGKRSDHE